MTPVVRVKVGVDFSIIAPGGFVLLAAIQHATQVLGHDITITSFNDGEHSGPNDPHKRGEAVDVRISDLSDHQAALVAIQQFLGTDRFFTWIEDENQPNEHVHAQVRKNTVYP